jgi:hypothetical protein
MKYIFLMIVFGVTTHTAQGHFLKTYKINNTKYLGAITHFETPNRNVYLSGSYGKFIGNTPVNLPKYLKAKLDSHGKVKWAKELVSSKIFVLSDKPLDNIKRKNTYAYMFSTGSDFAFSEPFFDKLSLKRSIILDNSIMDQDDLFAAVHVRVGIFLRRFSVSGPASMANSQGHVGSVAI